MKKISKGINKIVDNKYFLYVALFLAVTTILGFLLMQNWNAIIFFILIALISSYLTTNMGIVLFVSVIGANLVLLKSSGKEGLESQTSTESVEKTPNIINGETSQPLTSNNLGNATQSSMDTQMDKIPSNTEAISSVHQNEKVKSSSSRLDYMKTMEEAYDNLDSMLDGESLGKLTSDTQKLMKTQQELFKTMETMAPMVGAAKEMLEGFNMSDLNGLSSILGNKNK